MYGQKFETVGREMHKNRANWFTIICKMVDLITGYIFFLFLSKNVTNYTIYCGNNYQKNPQIDKKFT